MTLVVQRLTKIDGSQVKHIEEDVGSPEGIWKVMIEKITGRTVVFRVVKEKGFAIMANYKVEMGPTAFSDIIH